MLPSLPNHVGIDLQKALFAALDTRLRKILTQLSPSDITDAAKVQTILRQDVSEWKDDLLAVCDNTPLNTLIELGGAYPCYSLHYSNDLLDLKSGNLDRLRINTGEVAARIIRD